MTIHKAKGLEFDTVIVPGLDRPPRGARKPLFAWRALPGGRLLLAPIDETGADAEPLYRYVRTLDRDAEDIEAGRLFYVAATRAESRLHLLGCVKVDEHGVLKMPSRRSLLGIAWDALADQIALPAATTAEKEQREPLPDELKRLPADFKLPDPPEPVKWTAPDEGREEVEIEFSWAKEAVRHAGIVAHAWLQRIAEDELKGWDPERVDTLRPTITRDLQRRGVAPAELDRAANLVATALKNAITDERGRWLLGPHPVARNEYKLRNRQRQLPDRPLHRRCGGTEVGRGLQTERARRRGRRRISRRAAETLRRAARRLRRSGRRREARPLLPAPQGLAELVAPAIRRK